MSLGVALINAGKLARWFRLNRQHGWYHGLSANGSLVSYSEERDPRHGAPIDNCAVGVDREEDAEPTCRTCGDRYEDGGDGWDGECPSCADRTAALEGEA